MVSGLWSRIAGKGPCVIIAEAGVNHNGRLPLALKLVDAAAKAGADVVKFQTFRAGKLVTRQAPRAAYQKRNDPTGQTQFDMLKALELDAAAHRTIIAHCRKKKIVFLSTPFDEDSADMLEGLGMDIFKIPSGELTNDFLLRHIGRKRKSVILSTGMSTMQEVASAVGVLKKAGTGRIALLHCVSNYPAAYTDTNLGVMGEMTTRLRLPVGLSDHTLGIEIPIAAVAMGARVIEKHFTLDRRLKGPDHKASLEPAELAAMVRSVRNVESAVGNGIKRPSASEQSTRAIARRSIVSACDIRAGEIVGKRHLTLKRPGTGIPPSEIEGILGRTARVDIAADKLIRMEMLK